MKDEKLNSYLFEKNRQKLKRRLPALSVAILVSNDEMPRTADQFYSYRQNADLYYLTGITQPKTILCICPDFPDYRYHELLFIEEPTEYQQLCFGNRLNFEESSKISGIKNIYWLKDFEKILNELMHHARHVLLNFHENARSFDEVPLRDVRFTEKIKGLFPLHRYERLSPLMAELRQIKEPEEIHLVQQAGIIAGKALQKISRIIKPGINEYDIEAEIISEFIHNGSSGHAFAPIIASGKNACILHYNSNRDVCVDGDLVLIDIGAEYCYYNSDVTRTFPVNGKFNKRQLDVYHVVMQIHDKTISLIKPGTSLESLNIELIEMIEKELMFLGLIEKKNIAKQDPEKPLFKNFFMHSVSHFLGIDVHDVGNKNDILMPGMLLTCEPGIYIREEGIGIRLENDILVTSTGCLNLTEDIPLKPDEIEELMTISFK
jgi:Xaa-Pro aminopeptidase